MTLTELAKEVQKAMYVVSSGDVPIMDGDSEIDIEFIPIIDTGSNLFYFDTIITKTKVNDE